MDREKRTQWRFSLIVFLVVMLPVYILFEIRGESERGLAAALFGAMIPCAASAAWDQRRNWWFWAVLVVAAIINAILVMEIHWSDRALFGWMVGLIATLDGLAIYVVLKLVQKAFNHFERRIR